MKKKIVVTIDKELAKATHAAFIGYQQYQELMAQLITMGYSVNSSEIKEILDVSKDILMTRSQCYNLISLYTPAEFIGQEDVKWVVKDFDLAEIEFTGEIKETSDAETSE